MCLEVSQKNLDSLALKNVQVFGMKSNNFKFAGLLALQVVLGKTKHL